jgi:hypothetical protein
LKQGVETPCLGYNNNTMNNTKKTLFSQKTVTIGEESGYDNYIMAIESSCDETACAIVKNGREIRRGNS